MVRSCGGSEHLVTERFYVGDETDANKFIFMFENVTMRGN